jgi:hypothetical protein
MCYLNEVHVNTSCPSFSNGPAIQARSHNSQQSLYFEDPHWCHLPMVSNSNLDIGCRRHALPVRSSPRSTTTVTTTTLLSSAPPLSNSLTTPSSRGRSIHHAKEEFAKSETKQPMPQAPHMHHAEQLVRCVHVPSG